MPFEIMKILYQSDYLITVTHLVGMRFSKIKISFLSCMILIDYFYTYQTSQANN